MSASADVHPAPTHRRALRRAVAIAAAGLAGLVALLVGPLGVRLLVVESDSMAGTAPVGSLVITRLRPAHSVQVGDIILVTHDATGAAKAVPVLHRVTERRDTADGPTVVTKGDANEQADPGTYRLSPRTSELVTAVPKAGYAVALLHTPLAWFLLAIVPATILMTSLVRSLLRTVTGGQSNAARLHTS